MLLYFKGIKEAGQDCPYSDLLLNIMTSTMVSYAPKAVRHALEATADR